MPEAAEDEPVARTAGDSRPDGAGEESLLALAVELAREAGALVRERREAVARMEVAATKSTPTDVVTESDTAAEALIRTVLADRRPDDGILGEETGASDGTNGIVWVVDPIDGTVNYLYGIPHYAVSIGVQRDGVMVAGVVHNPVSGETFTALRGGGAFLDGRPIHVSSVRSLDRTLLATGFGYEAGRRSAQGRVVLELLPVVRDIRRFGVASLDLCAVAAGRVDGYYERGLKPWDLAAGGLIAQEAGALVTGLRGAESGESMVVAAPPAVHGALVGQLERLDADAG